MSTLYVNNISPQSGSTVTVTDTLVTACSGAAEGARGISFRSGVEEWASVGASYAPGTGSGLVLTSDALVLNGLAIVFAGIDVNNHELRNVPKIGNSFGAVELSGTIDVTGSLTFNGAPVTPYPIQDFSGMPSPYGFDSNGDMNGETIKVGSNSTVLSTLYYLSGSGTAAWATASAATTASSGPAFLALAIGTDPATDGMLTRGYARISGSLLADPDDANSGAPVFVNTGSGDLTFIAPSTSGDVVRIVGYLITNIASSDSIIYYNPDSTYVEVIQEAN